MNRRSKKEGPQVEGQEEANPLGKPFQERAQAFAQEYDDLVRRYGVSRMAVPQWMAQDNGSHSLAIQYTLQDLLRK